MSQVDFSSQFKDATQQVRQASGQVLDLTQQTAQAHAQLLQDQATAQFDLARSALEVRDLEGAKAFWFDAARVSREGFERFAQNAQTLFSEQVKLAEGFGRQAKDHLDAAAKVAKRR